jgi:DNA repair exonuclease SbcCD ATPase subunit
MTYDHDTPRTDASLTAQEAFCPEGLLKCSRDLECELTLQKEITKGWLISREVIIQERDELQDEVEELKQQKRNCIEIIDDDAKEKSQLKAEVERLEEQLTHFDDVHCKCVPRLKAEVERLRAILKDHATFLRKNGFDAQAETLDPK